MINNYINLKARIIDSLRSQGYRENWTYPVLKRIGYTDFLTDHLNKETLCKQ